MCLDSSYDCKTGKYKFLTKPYNDSNIRWKVLDIDIDINGDRHSLVSPFQNTVTWNVGKPKRAQRLRGASLKSPDAGFHVFITKGAAVTFAEDRHSEFAVVVKVEVDDFVAGGAYIGRKCETWKRAKIVEVYTRSGRHNITSRYTK